MVASIAGQIATTLVNRREAINRELARNGVRFGIYSDGSYHDRLFPYDPIPRVIRSEEFDNLERGLKQRMDALNAYLKDIYSDKNVVRDGVVPADFVYTSKGYYPQVNGVRPPGGIFAHVAGEDLVQGEDGQWWVLEDNLRIPSGVSYPLFVRDIERRICPTLFRSVHLRDNRGYPRLLRRSLDFVSTEGIAVVLSPGRLNSAFFEHAYLAEKLHVLLAFPEDLQVVENKLFFTDYAGHRQRVGVVYRRLTDDFLDPFAFNADSVIGVPGLLTVYRAGNVAIVNAPGCGVADDKAIYYFVPAMIKYYLHQEPLLRNAPTYMPMFGHDLKTVLARLGELVIKDVSEDGGHGVVFGSSLDHAERGELAEKIRKYPRRFIAQDVIHFRDIDVINPITGEASPRKADLRAFVVTGRQTHVWYSGLTRYSAKPGQMIVNSSQGGGFKDTWVLAPRPPQQRPDSSTSQEQRGSGAAQPPAPATAVLAAMPALVTASKVESLYWLGRYTERVFTTLSEFFPFYDRVMDTDVDAFRPFAKALDLPENFTDFDAFIRNFLYDEGNPNSVRSAIVAAFTNAVTLRPELGSRLLQYVELAMSNLVDASKRSGVAEDIYKQRDVTDNMLTFWGGIENSTVDPALKAFIFIGKYLERLDLYTRLGKPVQALGPSLRKLAGYALTLDGKPLAPCFVNGITWLIGQLPGRGYGEQTGTLKNFLANFNQRVVIKSGKDLGMLRAMNLAVHAGARL